MADRPLAPGRLELVHRFVNTRDQEDGIEELADPAAAAVWLEARGLVPEGTTVTRAELARLVAAREALRALLLANNGGPLAPDAVAALNRAVEGVHLAPRFGPDGTVGVVGEGRGVDRALGELVAIVQDAMADGTWSRLKACHEETCIWIFYDRSRNRSSQWCDMAVCGNRAKARTYRARQSPKAP